MYIYDLIKTREVALVCVGEGGGWGGGGGGQNGMRACGRAHARPCAYIF